MESVPISTHREKVAGTTWLSLLFLLLMLSTGVCTLLGNGQGGHVLRALWCFCNLFQYPLLFFALGRWSQNKAATVGQAGRLGAGFVLLYAVQKVLLFWAGTIRQTQPGFHLLDASDSSWLFLALAACLPLGALLDGNARKRGLILACAAAVGCAAGYCTVLGDFLSLSRFFDFFPLFLLGRWLDRTPEVKKWMKGLSLLLLVGTLGLCLTATPLFFRHQGLFLGIKAYANWRGGVYRLAQYAVALVLGGAVLALLPQRRLPRLARMGENWMSVWFWLSPILCLLTGTAALPKISGGVQPILVAILVCCVLTLLVSTRWTAGPVRAIMDLPRGLTVQPLAEEGVRIPPARLYWKAFCVVFLVLLTGFSSYFIEHGLSMIWVPDGQKLYLTIMYYTRDYVTQVIHTLLTSHHLILPQWDFSIGQGSSVLSVFHFNPLFLLAILTPESWMEGVYGAVTVLQIGLAGVAFTVYCHSIEKRAPLPVLVGAVMYAFSGFVIFTAAKHIYFMTFMVIYLPLILAGCERWLRQKRWGLFVGMIFLSLIGGYYYAFINTLLMALYLVIREFCVHRTKIKRILVDLLQLIGLYLCGAALSMVVFLPSLLKFLSSSRNDVTESAFSLFYPARHYLRLFLRFVGNDPSGIYWVRLGFAGVAFSAAVLLFLRLREKALRPLQVGMLVLTTCLCIPLMGKIFNGFGYVTNRWSYGFAFLMALIVVCLLPRLVEMQVWEQITLASVTAAYLVAVCLLEQSEAEEIEWKAMMLLALVTGAVILASHWKNKTVGQSLVAVITVAAVLVNLFQFYDPTCSDELDRYEPMGNMGEMLDQSAENVASQLKDSDCYRTEVEGNRGNRFCLCGGYGTTAYWSVLNGDFVNYHLDFDLNTVRQSYAVWGLDERASLCALGSVKYFVGKDTKEDGTPLHFQPYGFQPVGEEKGLTIYENQYALPMGYTYRTYQTRSDYNKLSPLERQQAILQDVVVEDQNVSTVSKTLKKSAPKLSTQMVPWTVTQTEGAAIQNHTVVVDGEKGGSFTLRFTGAANAETYVYLKGLTMQEGTQSGTVVRATGNTVVKKTEIFPEGSLYYFQREGVTFHLGYCKDGVRNCKITFEQPGTYTFEDLQVVCLPMQDYVQDVTALGETVLENVREENGTVSGTIRLNESRLLVLSIPYQNGWMVQVDGKLVKTYQVNGMYLGVLLTAGNHTVTASYETPGLKSGGIVSSGALVLTGCAVVGIGLRHWRKKPEGKRIRKKEKRGAEKC